MQFVIDTIISLEHATDQFGNISKSASLVMDLFAVEEVVDVLKSDLGDDFNSIESLFQQKNNGFLVAASAAREFSLGGRIEGHSGWKNRVLTANSSLEKAIEDAQQKLIVIEAQQRAEWIGSPYQNRETIHA